MSDTTSQTTICNSALLKLGADMITSLDENTRPANVCNALYASLRDEVMGSSPWRFASKYVILVPNSITPEFGYQYAYDIPNDCLRPLRLRDDSIQWTQVGPYIYADSPKLYLQYLFQNTDESSWDARFSESFAWRLAMELALSLTESIPKHQAMEKGYDKSLGQARAMNAVIGIIPKLETDIWSRARRGEWCIGLSTGQGGDPGSGPNDYNNQ